jgi:tyrosine-protein phosphatase non-receptor type 4
MTIFLQESSHLVVMLTTVMERGRVKCHQYWPANTEVLDMGDGFTVQCLSEHADETGSFVFRDLEMKDKKTGETRTLQHMQYLAWPGENFCEYSDKFYSNQLLSSRSRCSSRS